MKICYSILFTINFILMKIYYCFLKFTINFTLMKIYFSILLLTINFTLLQKTLLHEKYLSQGILIFNKIIL